MDNVKPNHIEGVPECVNACPHYGLSDKSDCDQRAWGLLAGNPCVPAIKQMAAENALLKKKIADTEHDSPAATKMRREADYYG